MSAEQLQGQYRNLLSRREEVRRDIARAKNELLRLEHEAEKLEADISRKGAEILQAVAAGDVEVAR